MESGLFFLYFGDQPLPDVSLANMFSHIVGSLLILMLFSLVMQKFLNLIKFVYSFLYVPFFRGCVCEDVAAWNV